MHADALVSLVAALEASPAMYVADSGIWSYPGDEALKLALADVVADQKGILDRAGTILAEREVAVAQVGYPLSYSAWHDLDLSYLLPRIIAGMKQQIVHAEAIIASGTADQAALGLAREAVAATRGHIDVLEQLAGRVRRTSAPA